jgi:hypothetical protein
MINPINHLPSRSIEKKLHKAEVSDSAIQFGTFETTLLEICNSPEAVSQFYAMASSSPDARNTMRVLYHKKLDEETLSNILKDIHSGQRKNKEFLDARLMQIGIERVHQYVEEEE